MKIELYEKPKNVIIIEGFPGFGLVGTISTEFLLDHLDTKLIGKIWISEMPAIAAIHQSKVVQPLSIHYNKKYNLVIVHGITATVGIEWKIADAVLDIAKQMSAKEILSLEGIGSNKMDEINPKVFYYCSMSTKGEKFRSYKVDTLNEGIIMGVTGALLIKNDKYPFCCLFAETASNLPDSRAAAKVLEILNQYLNLKIDTKPLLKQAEKFESKLKDLMKGSQKMIDEQKKKLPTYLG
ncbi:proteasome assembly chaperone family protein [Candidatus Woesearchaeota archaeon]|nr:proteasome assembly chaperone family protein [Candidatus Woesearchaeota archaeon]